MNGFYPRAALIVLALSGLLGMGWPLFPVGVGDSGLAPALLAGPALMLVSCLVGAACTLAVVVPALRPAAIGTAIVSKFGFLAWAGGAAWTGHSGLGPVAWIEAALLAGAVLAAWLLLREARREARWNGSTPLAGGA